MSSEIWVVKIMNWAMFNGLTDSKQSFTETRCHNAAWFGTKEKALEAVLRDEGYISEDGTNEFAVVLPFPEGDVIPYIDDFSVETWFMYRPDTKRYEIIPTPVENRQVLLNL